MRTCGCGDTRKRSLCQISMARSLALMSLVRCVHWDDKNFLHSIVFQSSHHVLSLCPSFFATSILNFVVHVQVLPMLGKDWTHSGVSELYSQIYKHGYKIMYLSSRAIGQSYITKNYILGVKQGQHRLPPGPVLLSPDRLLTVCMLQSCNMAILTALSSRSYH